MRLASFINGAAHQVGVVFGEHVVPIKQLGSFPNHMLALIQAGPSVWKALHAAQARAPQGLPLDAVRLLAPITRPPKHVLCLGLNYAAHAKESAEARGNQAELPKYPVVFTKAPTAINHPGADVPYNADVSSQIDWEVELAVVIGVGGRNIAREHALEHVFGYTILNDLTARDLQQRHKQYFIGKSLDGHAPMGPWIVTADELPDPQGLGIRSRVNGVTKQSGNTADMIFDVATTISILSKTMTLDPGDIIATGTPEGVGFARTPPEFLTPGDVVECEIDGIGVLRNQIAA